MITDPPYAIAATPQVAVALRARPEGSEVSTDCASCAKASCEGRRLCAACLEDLEIETFAAAGMLGQQSSNWHEAATHSRGYADIERKKKPTIANVAIARELAGWCWSLAVLED